MAQTWEEKLGIGEYDPSAFTETEEISPIQDLNVEAVEIEQAAKNDLNFLAGLAMPTIFRYFFPPTYLAIWNWLLEHIHKTRDFSQLALGFPRGFAKTTFVKLFVLYVILFTTRKFILICAANEKKAAAIVADVMDFLNESNIKKVFGLWSVGAETDNAFLKKFGFRGRNIIISASSVASVRGLNIKHERPDLIIFDDIQSREDADSPTISEQIEKDMYGTAMKAKSPHGCLFIFIGNMYPTKWSLLRRIKNNPTWKKFIAGGILSNGTSLWEELQPVEQLLKEYQNDCSSGHPEIFYAEVLNDETATVNHLIDISKLPAYPYTKEDLPGGKFIIIDPANNKSNSDNVAIGYFEVIETRPVLQEVIDERLSPGQCIDKALRLALKHNCFLIIIEANAYQYSLLYWFTFICAQYGLSGIQAVDIYSGNISKNSRILTMFKELTSGEIYYHPETAAIVNSEIITFNPLKTQNKDNVLDLLTYSTKAIAMYGSLIASHSVLEMQEYSSIPVRSDYENSPF